MIDDRPLHDLLLRMWSAGLEAVAPQTSLPRHLPQDRPAGRQCLFALGKAALPMAQAACRTIGYDHGLVIAPLGTARPADLPQGIALLCAPHPLPDESSILAARAARAFVQSLAPDDRLVALVSGGGSAMMAEPVAGLTLADKRAIVSRLLGSGAPIEEINVIRAALSTVKGGGLLGACGTRDVRLLVMSDVPGDDGRLVASGPFSPDAFSSASVADIASRYGIDLPACVRSRGHDGAGPSPQVFASARLFLDAAARVARDEGFAVHLLGDDLQGDAAALGRSQGEWFRALPPEPHIWLSGGECSVQVADRTARGGRNLTFALSAALALEGAAGIVAFAADSDGIDGNSAAAGAIIDGRTARRIREQGLMPEQLLRDNRSFDALAAAGDVLVTGATGVNVNDIRILVRR